MNNLNNLLNMYMQKQAARLPLPAPNELMVMPNALAKRHTVKQTPQLAGGADALVPSNAPGQAKGMRRANGRVLSEDAKKRSKLPWILGGGAAATAATGAGIYALSGEEQAPAPSMTEAQVEELASDPTFYEKLMAWAKENPELAIASGLGIGAAGLGGAYAAGAFDGEDEEEEETEKNASVIDNEIAQVLAKAYITKAAAALNKKAARLPLPAPRSPKGGAITPVPVRKPAALPSPAKIKAAPRISLSQAKPEAAKAPKPWYKNPWILGGGTAGTAAALGGGYALYDALKDAEQQARLEHEITANPPAEPTFTDAAKGIYEQGKQWIIDNPVLASLIALGGSGAAGYAAYNALNDEEEEENI